MIGKMIDNMAFNCFQSEEDPYEDEIEYKLPLKLFHV